MAENEMVRERYELAMERITLIEEEQKDKDGIHNFFLRTARFICDMAELKRFLRQDGKEADLETLSQWNGKM